MVKTYTKKIRSYNEEDIQAALDNVEQGTSCRGAARRHGVPAHVLRFRLNKKLRGDPFVGSGKKPLLNGEEEFRFAKYINSLCHFGFYPSRASHLLELTNHFIERKGSYYGGFNTGNPGKYWLEGYVQRHNFSLKNMRMMNLAHVNPTTVRHPLVIHNFYRHLEDIISEENLSPTQIWTCYEVGFPSNPLHLNGPTKFQAGAPGSTTCLAVCSANGQVFAPLIVHAGKGVRLDWMDSTSYAASESGCLTPDLFDDWCKMFLNTVTQRPLFIIVDSLLTHLPLDLVERAIVEGIHFIKLPCNTRKPLEPCFQQFEIKWGSILTKWSREHQVPMNEVDFVKQLCAIWYKCLSKIIIVEGYEDAGIYPVDRTKFPEPLNPEEIARLNSSLLSAIGSHTSLLGNDSNLIHEDMLALSSPVIPKAIGFGEEQASSSLVPIISQDQQNTFNPSSICSLESEGSVDGTVYSNQASFNEPDCANAADFTVSAEQNNSADDEVMPQEEMNSHNYEVCWCTRPPPPVPGKKWIPTWTLVDGSDPDANTSYSDIRDVRVILERVDDLIPQKKRKMLNKS